MLLSSLIFGECSFATYSAGGFSFSFSRTRRRPPSPIDLGRSLYCVQEVFPDYKRFIYGLCIALLRPFVLSPCRLYIFIAAWFRCIFSFFQQQRSLKLLCFLYFYMQARFAWQPSLPVHLLVILLRGDWFEHLH